jgi:hypothetical protein
MGLPGDLNPRLIPDKDDIKKIFQALPTIWWKRGKNGMMGAWKHQ